jgi:hypothetical protein
VHERKGEEEKVNAGDEEQQGRKSCTSAKRKRWGGWEGNIHIG